MARRQVAMLMLASSLLCVPFALVARAQTSLAESAAQGAVALLLRWTAAVSTAAVSESRSNAQADSPGVAEPSDDVAAGGTTSPRAPGRGLRARPPSKPQALFVAAPTVLALAESAARPGAAFVPRTPQHPAGLRLFGVGALGIGLQDGDILIEAMGFTPRSSGQIVSAVIEARAQRVRHLSGSLWRQGQIVRITVEQPYLDPA